MELRKTYISKIAPRKNYTGSPAALVYRVSPGIIGPSELISTKGSRFTVENSVTNR